MIKKITELQMESLANLSQVQFAFNDATKSHWSPSAIDDIITLIEVLSHNLRMVREEANHVHISKSEIAKIISTDALLGAAPGDLELKWRRQTYSSDRGIPSLEEIAMQNATADGTGKNVAAPNASNE